MAKTITIIGGGLSGLTLGIGLRLRQIPAVVLEAGQYPRHRVCGEFISGRGQQVLTQLGLREKFFGAGARLAETAAFFSGNVTSREKALPEPAWCLSRHKMDALLAEEFQRLGGELQTNRRWTGKDFGETFVRASGRRIHPIVNGWRWFGLKVHARNVRLGADLELHFVPTGYVGLCQLSEDKVNVCALLRSRTPLPELAQHWADWLKGPHDSALRERMANADLDHDSFCSVAGFSLEPKKASASPECCLGDALTMIPPLTGNGMSMAFESADLAIDPLAKFSEGKIPWAQAREEIAQTSDQRFAARLRSASWLQRGFFCPGIRDGLLWFGSQWPGAWLKMFAWTR